MRYWDVYHTATLKAERSLTAEAVLQAIARGDLLPDDLVRPAGETRWTKLGQSPEFASASLKTMADLPSAPTPQPPPPPVLGRDSVGSHSAEAEFDVLVEPREDRGQSEFEIDPDAFAAMDRDELRRAEADGESEGESKSDGESGEEFDFVPMPEEPRPAAHRRPDSSVLSLPVLIDQETQGGEPARYDNPIPDIDFTEYDPQDEDDEAAGFTLSRSKAETVEELDLAAMVDVAFQLVLFFLVTAQVVLFKTLEIPRPNDDKPPDAAVQAKAKSIDELKDDYILVEVDAAGTIKIDRQPVPAQRSVLIERLRKTREDTQRKAMLLSADFATRHEHAVLVFDVANEIDLKIAIAQPAAKK